MPTGSFDGSARNPGAAGSAGRPCLVMRKLRRPAADPADDMAPRRARFFVFCFLFLFMHFFRADAKVRVSFCRLVLRV